MHAAMSQHDPVNKQQQHMHAALGNRALKLVSYLCLTGLLSCLHKTNTHKHSTRHRAEHVHHDFFDVWSCRVRDLKEFGVGE